MIYVKRIFTHVIRICHVLHGKSTVSSILAWIDRGTHLKNVCFLVHHTSCLVLSELQYGLDPQTPRLLLLLVFEMWTEPRMTSLLIPLPVISFCVSLNSCWLLILVSMTTTKKMGKWIKKNLVSPSLLSCQLFSLQSSVANTSRTEKSPGVH